MFGLIGDRPRPGGAQRIGPNSRIWGSSSVTLGPSRWYNQRSLAEATYNGALYAAGLDVPVAYPFASSSAFTMSDAGAKPHNGSPEQARLYRISTLKDFLPLSEDTSLSTRGQHLPGLIASRSSNNVSGLRDQGRGRRRSSLGSDDLPRRSNETDRPAQQPNGYHDPDVARRYNPVAGWGGGDEADQRRMSMAQSILYTPEVRSQRLIGNSNPRYRWEQYWKTDEDLRKMPKKIRKYYERNNYLIQHYMYIDRLLDSSLPHHLIQEYQQTNPPKGNNFSPSDVPTTITEEPTPRGSPQILGQRQGSVDSTMEGATNGTIGKIKRTPKDIYMHRESAQNGSTESTPLLTKSTSKPDEEAQLMPPELEVDEEASSQSRIVTVAIWVNFAANTVLLIMKIAVAALTNSVSVLASLVDAALDFLSTAIIWVSKYLIENSDQYGYPIGKLGSFSTCWRSC